MQQFLREKVNPKCQTALFIDTYRSGDGYFACGEYSAPCRLQAGLTRSAVRMRTRVCVPPYIAKIHSTVCTQTGALGGRLPKKGLPVWATGISPAANILHLAAYKPA